MTDANGDGLLEGREAAARVRAEEVTIAEA